MLFELTKHVLPKPVSDTLTEAPSTTFQSLRPRLINLLMQALNGETDSLNVQMLLGKKNLKTTKKLDQLIIMM